MGTSAIKGEGEGHYKEGVLIIIFKILLRIFRIFYSFIYIKINKFYILLIYNKNKK